MHGWSVVKGFDISLASNLFGKAFHLEAEKGGGDDVDGLLGEFGELVHGAFAAVEVSEEAGLKFIEAGWLGSFFFFCFFGAEGFLRLEEGELL